MLGLAVALKVDLHCYVPPHDDAEKWPANLLYQSMQFLCSTGLRKKQCIYLVIRGGHFEALSTPSVAPRKWHTHTHTHTHTVMDLFASDVDSATSKCVSISVMRDGCVLAANKKYLTP